MRRNVRWKACWKLGRRECNADETTTESLAKMEFSSQEIERPAFDHDILCIFIIILNFGRERLREAHRRRIEYSSRMAITVYSGRGSSL